MKKLISFVLLLAIFFSVQLDTKAKSGAYYGAEYTNKSFDNENDLDIEADGAYLIEATTGKVLYAKNEYKAASPASVTKIMTLLLVCEAIEDGRISLNDIVTVSAKAASMGGSQVFLEEGERMTVEELIKCTVIASGNDSALALAEHTAGSESAFVKLMNKKAGELGLKATSFENTTGLDDTTTNHYSCPADIGKMSIELIRFDFILKYSSMWQDTIRNGEFTLTNTNRLVRYYDGCNGLKTGSTDRAGFCISATAKRDNMQLIAVIMGAPTSKDRNEAAKTLLNYGFANYAIYERGEEFVETADVLRGKSDFVELYASPFICVIDKTKIGSVELIYEIPEKLNAPIEKNVQIGRIVYKIGVEQIGESEIYAICDVEKISYYMILERIIKRMICG